MRYLYLVCPALLWSSVSLGQTERKMTPVRIPTNIQRYQDDYELKNYDFEDGDSSVLNSIDLKQYESFRQLNEHVEIELNFIHTTLILYSVESVGKREKSNL
jgi:hypothetical protein